MSPEAFVERDGVGVFFGNLSKTTHGLYVESWKVFVRGENWRIFGLATQKACPYASVM